MSFPAEKTEAELPRPTTDRDVFVRSLQRRLQPGNARQSGSKFGNISSVSASVLNGTQSQVAKNLFHIARTFGLLCAASIELLPETAATLCSR
jgi:hypothetical protein